MTTGHENRSNESVQTALFWLFDFLKFSLILPAILVQLIALYLVVLELLSLVSRALVWFGQHDLGSIISWVEKRFPSFSFFNEFKTSTLVLAYLGAVLVCLVASKLWRTWRRGVWRPLSFVRSLVKWSILPVLALLAGWLDAQTHLEDAFTFQMFIAGIAVSLFAAVVWVGIEKIKQKNLVTDRS